ncbi:MAG: methyltransferase domain-containing protein [Thermoplasmata archaeon]|nr:methyltransferase domain-containing protein [Thermoplasmata archaeon]
MRRLRPKGIAAGRGHTDLLLEAAELQLGLRVLDLACGTGEPALEEARRVGADGRVTGLDSSETLVSYAREYAREERLAQAGFEVGSAESLPYPDCNFDRVTSRFGAMYFTDLARAVSESYRVLRPGGRLAWLVWGTIEQPFWQATALVALRHAGMSRLPPEALQPFCFGNGGILSHALSAAGFDNVREVQKEVTWSWPGPPEEVCSMFFSGSPPFQAILDSLGPEARTRAEKEITESLRAYYSSEQVNVPEIVIVATGRRPSRS